MNQNIFINISLHPFQVDKKLSHLRNKQGRNPGDVDWIRQINIFVVLPYLKKIISKTAIQKLCLLPLKTISERMFQVFRFYRVSPCLKSIGQKRCILGNGTNLSRRCKLAFVKENEASKSNRDSTFMLIFLGPRGPHGIPLSVSPLVSPSVRKKNLDHIYTGLYAS